MPCPGSSSGSRTIAWLFRNWARTRSFSIPVKLQPTSLEEVVAGVQEVESGGGILKAMGSGWSYTDAAISPEVTHAMDTSSLKLVLSGSDPESRSTLIPFALKDEARGRHLVHVEGGIKIHELNCVLDAQGRAMPTLGGSNGQSLAGVLSTATHGSDVDMPPITDAVRAIHLVGPGGQEWWIEPEGDEAITDPARMAIARDEEENLLCSDIRIEYDNELFDAALVSIGRMGVIYSVVLEAVDAFNLEETRETSTWETMAPVVRRDVVDATTYSGPRFLEIVLSPYRNGAGQRECVVTRRVETDAAPDPDPPPRPDIFSILCNISALTPILAGLAALVPGLIAAATGAALATISWILFIPFIGGFLHAAASTAVVAAATGTLVTLETALISFLTTPGENIASKLANIINLATAVGQKQIVPAMINAMITFIRAPTDEPIVGQSFRIMTGQSACGTTWRDAPNCMHEIDGLEFAVDASPGTETMFNFLDDIFALTDEFFDNNRPPGFGMSLRFSKRTRALLGMQQFARTCSVEFIMLRGLNGHDEFLQRVYRIARTHGAIPHWGLIHEINGSRLRDVYGEKHTQWRMQLDRLIKEGGGRVTTFSTPFSIQRELEPLPGCTVPPRLVDLFRRILLALARSRGMDGVMGKRPARPGKDG
ncbi:MAG TPA: D-arabinono-1,4-lactone oxidase [Gammaproteobacteria bacterium]